MRHALFFAGTAGDARPVYLLLAATVLALAACGGGGDSADSAPDSPAGTVRAAAVSLASEPSGANCTAGGSRIDSGIDTNGNGTLDATEITSVQYVCNGVAGATGATGSAGVAGATGATGNTGATGSAGITSLVSVSSEPAGVHCAQGGSKVSVGPDTNGNGVLDSAEVSSTAYVCRGSDGTAGATGHNSLLAAFAESAGAHCTYGGTRVTSGIDTNDNGVLEAGEVTATSYNCNGAPGPGVTWVSVSATSATMASNTGYLADNAAQVTLTLPTLAAVGDVFSVSGIGAGGWKIAQNAGQSIVIDGTPSALGSNAGWVPHENNRSWYAVASSADGVKLLAAEGSGQLYTSTDSGVTWAPRENNRNWISVASSADGNLLLAAEQNGQLYTSADAGITWTARDSVRNWQSVASSAGGSRLVAVEYSGRIYTSTDAGVTWTARDSNRGWAGVTSSADGMKLVAGDNTNGQLYTSADGGVTWALSAAAPNAIWYALASSADGTKLVAVARPGQIYTSVDSGATWTARESERNWQAVASSADGSKLLAADIAGKLYVSNNSGVTWLAHESDRNWFAVASSSDGSRLLAGQYGGKLYTLGQRTAPGTTGWFSGSQFDAVDLQYTGNGLFMVRSYTSHSGLFGAF